ncbi:restriction endonuclease [Pasteurellaceae bacterium HPA106]|uniref:GIY-YIG nuclease family protein n=1 Tax=Spirabiliibacterium pneumoniae TaxID=221400 RepID=UPI001AADB9E4|nr:GIY-YIG nuclease family protein [Spirabiliibacterium pneumoniae]MBE2895409.1 restriction endonuclease [Spirabiliibacterium pneumoniae]
MNSLLSRLATPTIYAYQDSRFPGCLKVGFTQRSAAERVREQQSAVKMPSQSWKIVLEESAVCNDKHYIRDHDVHRILAQHGFERLEGEWFRCGLNDVKKAINIAKNPDKALDFNRTCDFAMRPEQQSAVEKTADYFRRFHQDPMNKGKEPKFLWNAKMRFGKTFAAYQLVKTMGWKRVLILTFKPAVQSAWEDDLAHHVDFNGWHFVNNISGATPPDMTHLDKPMICFSSLQNVGGKTKQGKIKAHNQWLHDFNWDCIIFDEYHFGAWKENTKKLVNDEVEEAEYCDTDDLPITCNHYLYLSGTPFRALQNGEFIEEAIYNWTYSDEQHAKAQWQGENNPYAALPQMVMLTYKLSDDVINVAQESEFNEFSLNEFFKAEGEKDKARFVYEESVQKWLNIIRYGSNTLHTSIDELRMGAEKPPMPFSDSDLLNALLHTVWFLPDVAACHAMANLLRKKANQFYHDYHIVVAAGAEAGIGVKALAPVRKAIGKNGLKSKSITLTCGKLTTGVSVPEWTGIFMLRNSSTPESYFQAAFRVQTPWTLKGQDRERPNDIAILKEKCYVFDFAPNRALSQIAEYSNSLNADPDLSLERKVADFIEFMPVLAYDGGVMTQINAEALLDIATKSISATLLARRWQSALLVNVNNDVLKALQNNPQALAALQKIEGFRSLHEDISTIINKSEAIKDKKKKQSEGKLNTKEEKELKADEKERTSLRKEIQKKLIQFATRIPIFMYLTDDRENTLKDVITQVEPELFEKVTGLTQEDFELLVQLNLFNESLMNSAIYNFRRYEDASLNYTGIDRHQHELHIGLWDTTITQAEYQTLDN